LPLGHVASSNLVRLELDIPTGSQEAPTVTRAFTDQWVPTIALASVRPGATIRVRYDSARPSDVYIDFAAMGYRLR